MFAIPRLSRHHTDHQLGTTHPAAIDPAYLTHPVDAAVLAAGLDFCQLVAKSPHLTSQIARQLVPKAELNVFNTVKAAKAIREHFLTE